MPTPTPALKPEVESTARRVALLLTRAVRSDWGEQLHAAALWVARPIAATYVAGYETGLLVHRLSSALAEVARTRIAGAPGKSTR